MRIVSASSLSSDGADSGHRSCCGALGSFSVEASNPDPAAALSDETARVKMKAEFNRWHFQVWGVNGPEAWRESQFQIAVQGWCIEKMAGRVNWYFNLPWVVTQMGSINGRVDTLYRAVFNRAPSQAEIDYWAGLFNNGTVWPIIVDSFANSVEGKNRYRATCPREHNFTTVWQTVGGWWRENVPFNGVRVYLSSPRHDDEIPRRGCGFPNNGYKENVNGYQFNRHALESYYFVSNFNNPTTWDENTTSSNLGRRGYGVVVSPNSHVASQGWKLNRNAAQNWPADVVVVTHSNGSGLGCHNGSNSHNYLLTIYRDSYPESVQLATYIKTNLDFYAPGTYESEAAEAVDESDPKIGSCCGEFTTSTHDVAYTELAFHTNAQGNDWMRKQSRRYATLYGLSIDQHLGFP